MSKTDQIVGMIRKCYPDKCVEELFGMTCSLESSVEEFAAQFPDAYYGDIACEWIMAAGDPERL